MEQELVPALNSMLGFLNKAFTVLSIPRHHTPWSMGFMMSFHIVRFSSYGSNCYLIGHIGIRQEYFEGQVVSRFTNSREDQGRVSGSANPSIIELQAVDSYHARTLYTESSTLPQLGIANVAHITFPGMAFGF